MIAARRRSTVDVDTTVPALLMKIGRYPIHHGGLGVVRTLGRLGVDVYAVTEDRLTPTACSRYLRSRFVWPTNGTEDASEIVAGLLEIGERIGRRAVLLVTDDEAAVLIAEHAGTLGRQFLLPAVEATLPRRLASKRGLSELCREYGVSAPAFGLPRSLPELVEIAGSIGFPLILKNDEAWKRLANPAVASTTIVRDLPELERLAAGWPSMPSVIVQEYIPRTAAEDWIVHLHAGGDAGTVLAFTGVKLRSWPAHVGATAVAYTASNPDLAAMAVAFSAAIGFRGVGDMDWRLDPRDGQYKLLDFNPRVGAQFRMFETRDGVDVVRALHLELTGREVPVAGQIDGRRFVAEHYAVAAAPYYRSDGGAQARRWRVRGAGVERAWLAADDPLPALVTAIRVARPTLRGRAQALIRRDRADAGEVVGGDPVAAGAGR